MFVLVPFVLDKRVANKLIENVSVQISSLDETRVSFHEGMCTQPTMKHDMEYLCHQ